ncbi:hypothetical protein Pan54_46010 [Rubinisphaera italica]|uniref:Uncharacterized protein n=2 Tax=Rubinisphaera italica TaxID=2527969 RepID=A0A5C5XQ02_9PLAN|nr:hypothetical protein Pan54_46010 [Rubinisphaera italica]
MSVTSIQLEAGGLLPIKSKVDSEATEEIVARDYRHPALGDRAVVRLTSDRLGEAEDLAMEFLGFETPKISKPIAIQQRRSLGFAAWALVNDPDNARYALNLVKRMKAAARKAKSKPGHAWDVYTELAKELGRSVRHFLPPYWEEVGRTYKDLGNQTYAGRALTKSLEAERVHALESDRARRRDVVLEFVLAGCLAGKALSDYAGDLIDQYPPEEAFRIFRDLCLRRTLGGMAPWAAMPKDFNKLAKNAGLDEKSEMESWLLEAIHAPAMGRTAHQFWKSCSKQCKNLVKRSPEFAVALLRHTKPETRYYGESKLWPWINLLEEWGTLEFLWEDEHKGAPPLGEPIVEWFSRIIKEQTPVPLRVLEMFENLIPRLILEDNPLSFSREIDLDLLEACLKSDVKVEVDDQASITFDGWLIAEPDHKFRNQDPVLSIQDERYLPAIFGGLHDALQCRGSSRSGYYRQADWKRRSFPLAAGDRPAIKKLWHDFTDQIITSLEGSGLESFKQAKKQLKGVLWPQTLKLFPDLNKRLLAIDPSASLHLTLQAGIFDEYGIPAFDAAIDKHKLKIRRERYGETNLYLTFPEIILVEGTYAYRIHPEGTIEKVELKLPKGGTLRDLFPVGKDLGVEVRINHSDCRLIWMSDPGQEFQIEYSWGRSVNRVATSMSEGRYFFGKSLCRAGQKSIPEFSEYLHDGENFWRVENHYDYRTSKHHEKVISIDPETGKELRESVPAWFEETDRGTVHFPASELLAAPVGTENSPLGSKNGLLGWKAIRLSDNVIIGEGIDGRTFTTKGMESYAERIVPVALLNQPGTNRYLPVTTFNVRGGSYSIWDPEGKTVITEISDCKTDSASGQPTVLPILYWHLLKLRDEASSKSLRKITRKQSDLLLLSATKDREHAKSAKTLKDAEKSTHLRNAIAKFLPKAPERLVYGLLQVIKGAEEQFHLFDEHRDLMMEESQKDVKETTLVETNQVDQAAAHWDLDSIHYYNWHENASLLHHLKDVSEFLAGNRGSAEITPTNYLWFNLLESFPLRCWSIFWKIQPSPILKKSSAETHWLEFLKFWNDLKLFQLPGTFSMMGAELQQKSKSSSVNEDDEAITGKSLTIQNGEDRFIIIAGYNYNTQLYHILRYSTAKKPGNPPGYKVFDCVSLPTRDTYQQCKEFLKVVKANQELPLPSKEELEQVAESVGATPAEIGLIWMCALNIHKHESNFLPSELRKKLGWKVIDTNAARQALKNINSEVLQKLLVAVISPGLAAPFAEDRTPCLKAIEQTWKLDMPKRLPLDATLQKRLSSISQAYRYQQPDLESTLDVAADPKHPLLKPCEIVIDDSKNYEKSSYYYLGLFAKNKSESVAGVELYSSIARLIALVHNETPLGHGAREFMPALLKQVHTLFNSPKTLLLLRPLHIYSYDAKKAMTPLEWTNKHLGKTKQDRKSGLNRYSDELISAAADAKHHVFIAFHPASLKDSNSLARLRGLLEMEVGPERVTGDPNSVSIVNVLNSPGYEKISHAILGGTLSEDQWPQNPLLTAPKTVAGIQKKLKLSEDAAVLYAQVLALPDPTTANVRQWNDWTAARYKKAAGELVEKELVLDAKRSRAGRSIFLPGEWLDLKAPWLPIEAWKKDHLVDLALDIGLDFPIGGPMVLRPYEDLFPAVWQRILDGDKPEYEEASL